MVTQTPTLANGSSSSSGSNGPVSFDGDETVILGRYDTDHHEPHERRPAPVSSVPHWALDDQVRTASASASASASAASAVCHQCVRHNSAVSPHATSTNDDKDYRLHMECVRLLIRTLQAPPLLEKSSVPPSTSTSTSTTTSTSTSALRPANDPFDTLARDNPDLWTLQNAIWQLQHAVTLAQDEAATALDDAAVATRAADQWRRDCLEARTQLAAYHVTHATLVARTERLAAEKRVLKRAYQDLAARQYSYQTKQVEAYVVSALVTHEHQLHKNRSRATTETTVEDEDGQSQKVMSSSTTHEVMSLSSQANPATTSTLSMPPPTTTPTTTLGTATSNNTAVSRVTPAQIAPAKKELPRNVGFGATGALGFGTTFTFKKLQEQQRKNPPPPTSTYGAAALPPVVTSVSPYEPVRFDLIPLSRSSDDEADSTTSIGSKMKSFFQLPTGETRRNTPLISFDALLHDKDTPSCCTMPHNVSFGPDDSVASGLESPLVPSVNGDTEESDSPSLTSTNGSSALWSNTTIEACDPAVLRSLSIPLIYDEVPPTRSFKAMPFRPHKFV